MWTPWAALRRRGQRRLPGVRTAKTTLAAVAAYAAAVPLSSNASPVLAPLTALLVVQVTLYDTLRSGLRRVVSVMAGVLVAVGFAATVHLNALTLGVVVAASLVIGRLLRLGAEMLEVPISAMLVIAVGGSDVAATGRVLETVVGAVVGVIVNALIAPPLYVKPASDAVRDLGNETAAVLRRVADEVADEYTRDTAVGWLDAARELGRSVLRADRALSQAENSLRLNPRTLPVGSPNRVNRPAVGVRFAGSSLRSGLDTLERVSVSVRGICRSLADRAVGAATEQVYAEDVRACLSAQLRHLADAVAAYGELIGAEVVERQPQDVAVRDALAAAWEDRARLTDLLQQEPRLRTEAWQLHGDLLANIDRLLRDIDVEARAQLRETWGGPAGWRPRPAVAVRARLREPRRRP